MLQHVAQVPLAASAFSASVTEHGWPFDLGDKFVLPTEMLPCKMCARPDCNKNYY